MANRVIQTIIVVLLVGESSASTTIGNTKGDEVIVMANHLIQTIIVVFFMGGASATTTALSVMK